MFPFYLLVVGGCFLLAGRFSLFVGGLRDVIGVPELPRFSVGYGFCGVGLPSLKCVEQILSCFCGVHILFLPSDLFTIFVHTPVI